MVATTEFLCHMSALRLHYREILDPVVLKPEKKTTAANDVYEGHFHHGHKMQEGTYVYSLKTPRYTYKKVLLS